MNKITMKTLIQKTIYKYSEKRQHLRKDFNKRKKERIKNTIYEMVIECLEICLPLSKMLVQKNIKLTDIVENYNKYLPFKVNIDLEKTRKIIEKIKNKNEGQTSREKLKIG